MKLKASICLLMGMAMGSFSVSAAEYTATVDWANEADLSLPVSGVIAEVKASPGQVIKAGEEILSLDQRYFDAKLMAARAEMDRYKPARDEAKRELDRALELYERQVLSTVELDLAKNDFAEKEAIYTQARANYTQAKLDSEYSRLKAPFDLIILEPHVVKGQTIINEMQAVPLVSVASTDKMSAILKADVADLETLKLGGKLDVTNAGRSAKAVVSGIKLLPGAKYAEIEVEFESKGMPSLQPGANISVKW